MMINNQITGLSMPYLRLVLGIAALLTELYFNIAFLSQGVTGAAFWGAISFCLITDTVKILFAGDVSYYSSIKQSDKALFAFMMTALLVCLSIFASLWFLVSNPLKNDVTLQNVTARTAQLQQQVAAKQQQVASCNPSYVTKCVAPMTAQLTALETELSKAMSGQDAMKEAAANKAFWDMTAKSVGTSSENLQLGMALIRSIILELLGVVLCGQFFGHSRLQSNPQSLQNVQPTQTPPAAVTQQTPAAAQIPQQPISYKISDFSAGKF